MITEGEGIQETSHEEIMVLRGENGIPLKELRKHIKRLVNFAEAGAGDKIREELKRIVPEYEPQG